jgi:LCP family protein required for cell wall assembly
MTRTPRPSWDSEVLPRVRQPARHRSQQPMPPRRHPQSARHRRQRPSANRSRGPVVVGARVLAGVMAAAVLAATGVGWAGYRGALEGITTSHALDGGLGGPASAGGAHNILIMGLDSRLDQHGNPLPQHVYDALHAGDETVGGYNANVLMVVHLPGGDAPATAFSIPRDDYVDLANCPPGQCQGKIKQAYGLAYQHAMDSLDTTSSTSKTAQSNSDDPAAREQQAREAGRKAQIATVRRLLGIPIDHFIEITLGAFFQLAKVVEPITVCLNGDTSDPYSGADFHQGTQQIDAAQAMAFVRQRRDVNDENFTDLDRTRRQQAFIASLISALRRGGALDSPSTQRRVLQVAQQNIAVDTGLDLAGFAQRASALTDKPPSLYTLPITEFSQDPAGEDINKIDVPTIRAVVADLVSTGSPATSTSARAAKDNAPFDAGGQPAVLNVINATTHDGLASHVQTTFAAKGFSPGVVGTADALAATSTIDYGPGAQSAAQALANQLDLTATASDTVPAGAVQLMIGTDFPAGDYSATSSSSTTSPTTTTVTTVAATATGTHTPASTDLSRMTAAGVPCVK